MVVAAVVVVVVGGFVVEVDTMTSVVGATAEGTVMVGSSTNGSLGTGRPAMAMPAIAPTTITATANGQDLRMRPAKLAAVSKWLGSLILTVVLNLVLRIA